MERVRADPGPAVLVHLDPCPRDRVLRRHEVPWRARAPNTSGSTSPSRCANALRCSSGHRSRARWRCRRSMRAGEVAGQARRDIAVADHVAAVRCRAAADAHDAHLGLAVPVVTQPHHVRPGSRIARPTMCSGRTGTRASGRPVAARSADTTAGVDEIVGGSPTPRSPYGAAGRRARAPAPASAGCRGSSGSGSR